MASKFPTFRAVGENAVLVEFEPQISLPVNQKVHQFADAIDNLHSPHIVEVIPAYRSLMVYFDPAQTSSPAIITLCRQALRTQNAIPRPTPRHYRLPTVYDSDHGPDLQRVADAKHLSPAQVISLFSTQQFPVYCLGFLCCLAYLGGVPETLHVPRLTSPRTHLPAGSVGMAMAQAVVLPIDQPSGWHYLGRTFVTVYEPRQFPPTLLRPGDVLEFPSVSPAEAQSWQHRSLGECLCAGSESAPSRR